MHKTGIEEDALRGRGLAGINVGCDANVAGSLKRILPVRRVDVLILFQGGGH